MFNKLLLPKYFSIRFLFENSVFLLVGAMIALVWANTDSLRDSNSYRSFIEFNVAELFEDDDSHDAHADNQDHPSKFISHASPVSQDHDEFYAHAHASGGTHNPSDPGGHSHGHGLTIAFLINDIFMAFFFAIAAKEVWESMLPGGSLSNPQKAATPLMATLGGILGPAGVYLLGSIFLGRFDELGQGWAIPCATDIAFSYLIARLIFGKKHPAIAFLLLLAIADDAAGLAILAVFYPSAEVQPIWFLATVLAIGIGLTMQKLHVRNFWWYLLVPGTLSWFSFFYAGIHPALGLVPIIPTMPSAQRDMGIFAKGESYKSDTLNQFEHWWKCPVELILGCFALVNAGVILSTLSEGTYLVLAGLLIGKPLGIVALTWLAVRKLKLEMPAGMNMKHIIVIGFISGLGFTVALFVATAAFPIPGAIQDSAKMGALASFLAAILAILAAKILQIGRFNPVGELQQDPDLKPNESTADTAVSALT